MTAKRLYRSGTGWCVWRWTFTPSGYLTRLFLLKTPWWTICLHFINGPDPELEMHDHPVTFLSVILWGGYTEIRSDGPHARRLYNFVRATDAHVIVHVLPRTVTLAFMGPKVREWGFHTADGWVGWRTYNEKYR